MKRVITLFLLLAGFRAEVIFAQQKASGLQAKQTTALPAPDANVEDSSGSGYQSSSGTMFTLAGGYYEASGAGMDKILKPSYSIMLSANNNNLSGTLFGLGIDGVYSSLKDKDVSGGIIYTTIHPHVTAAFPVFNWFDVMLKGGPGISVLTSTLNSKVTPSVTFTLGGGGGIVRVFGQHFVMGIEADYYYFFQRESSAAMAGYFYMGYRL
jgi:hypothetical protein